MTGEHGIAGKALPHESAWLHVSGEAQYVDDLPEPKDMLHAAVGLSAAAHARLRAMDFSRVAAAEGVVTVLTAEDIPGANDYGLLLPDDPLFAESDAEYAGQCLFSVLAGRIDDARRAVRLAEVEYEHLDANLDVRSAVASRSFVVPSRHLRHGEADAVLGECEHRLHGTVAIGGQEHFYLEGQVAMALPREDGRMTVLSSTQHPGQVQEKVARLLGRPLHDIVVECPRMGGGFGGKETQAALVACIAALGASKTRRAVKLRLDRDDDMLVTGKRHAFEIDYEVGFDRAGRIQALKLVHLSNCGRSADLSPMVNERALLQSDNCYYLEHVSIDSHHCKTNHASNTAFRGFGAPQCTMGIEHVVDEIARYLGMDPLDARRVNFYGKTERNRTYYGMVVEDNILHELVGELEIRSRYRERRKAVAVFNADSSVLKRGLALVPVKHGISFPATFLNQAGALVHVYTDGTIMLNHGGTEMGQGLNTKVAQVVAEEFRVDLERVRCTPADTAKVPNASPTASSASSDLYGKAAQAAARKIKKRLASFAAQHFGSSEDEVHFGFESVRVGDRALSFKELIAAAYFARVSLSATGFYRTPKIHFDPKTIRGRPFFYFVYGAAVAEVVVDTLTGEHKLLDVHILQDVGCSINPAIDIGQIEGAFMQGVGLVTCEELCWDEEGRLQTHAPSTYKIPTVSDWPERAKVELVDWSRNREETIFRSKGIGEPPLMLAFAVLHAIRDAIAAVGGAGALPRLDAPATPQAVLACIEGLHASAEAAPFCDGAESSPTPKSPR